MTLNIVYHIHCISYTNMMPELKKKTFITRRTTYCLPIAGKKS